MRRIAVAVPIAFFLLGFLATPAIPGDKDSRSTSPTDTGVGWLIVQWKGKQEKVPFTDLDVVLTFRPENGHLAWRRTMSGKIYDKPLWGDAAAGGAVTVKGNAVELQRWIVASHEYGPGYFVQRYVPDTVVPFSASVPT